MRIQQKLAAVFLALATTACAGGDASSGAADDARKPATVEEVRALLDQHSLGGGDKDVAGERFYELAQRAAPALLQITNDPTTSVDRLHDVLFVSQLYVADPAIMDALRARARAIPDREERELFSELIEALATTPGLPYPR